MSCSEEQTTSSPKSTNFLSPVMTSITSITSSTSSTSKTKRSSVLEVLTTPELIHNIFEYLSVPQLVKARSVCKQWYQIVSIPSRVASYINYTVSSKPKKVYILTNSTYSYDGVTCITDTEVYITGVYTNKRKAQIELSKKYEQEQEMYSDLEDDNTSIMGGIERRGYFDYASNQGEVWELGEYDLNNEKLNDNESLESSSQQESIELESVEENGVTYYIID
ncbi:7960_t:CDS:1 [Diversispora eburnea]|uniref:7960_t:CDS:1 n=1 Tax=Diversispora eburnea TaxID=1213867 RepID=A0A9N9A5C5_9GLOM|nr:7960_t:CDS:1 [Diversispora eburnea]